MCYSCDIGGEHDNCCVMKLIFPCEGDYYVNLTHLLKKHNSKWCSSCWMTAEMTRCIKLSMDDIEKVCIQCHKNCKKIRSNYKKLKTSFAKTVGI